MSPPDDLGGAAPPTVAAASPPRPPGRDPGHLALGWRLARRELRGGLRGLRVVLACLALGVAAIAAVGTLRAAIEAGLAADGARLLGGDLAVTATYRPLPEETRSWLVARGARLSDEVQMRAMAVAPSGDRTLVELKAVDGAYPLYGELVLDPPGPLGEGAGGLPPVALEPLVADRLGLAPGDVLRLGEARFVFRGTILVEPDKVASPAILGPRALVSLSALEATRLVQPGSLVQYETRAALPPGTAEATARELRAQPFADGGWRVRLASQGQPGVNRFVDQTASFLTLAGLTALLVGGIGVATGVRSWLDGRARSIATLRCLGAPSGTIFAAYLLQVAALAAGGIAVGLVAGYGLTWLAASALSGALPVPPRLGLYPAPLLLAALYGALTALAFALWPLGRAREIPGAALFRDQVEPRAGARPRLGLLLANAAAVAALVLLVVSTAQQPRFALAFCAAALATLVLFRGAAWALAALARRVPARNRPALRLGLANLHRPGAPTALMLVSLGIGLSTLAAVALIQGNLRAQITRSLPDAAPSFFFIDIQSDQAEAFDRLAASLPGVMEVRRVPSLRARVVAVDGVPADRVQATEETRWALRGDRGLTYADAPPEGTRLVAGAWWPPGHRGEPLASFDANLARGWGVGIGSVITVNVLGRDVDLRVASLRDVDWRGLGINFTLIASPGLLEAAPHTHIATLRDGGVGDPRADAAVLRAVTDAFPNVSGIRVRDALEAVADLLRRLGAALGATSALTLLSGLLVLGGAVAAGQRRRIRDAVVLKTLGATRAQLRRAWLVEFGLLGLVAGLAAAAVGTAASWAVVRYVMRGEWVFLPATLALTVAGCVALTLVLGYLGTALALRARAAPLLRNE